MAVAARPGARTQRPTLAPVESGVRLDPATELRLAAASGLMALTGLPDGPPIAPPPGVVGGLAALAGAVGRWSAEVGAAVDLSWERIVTGRAAALGLRRGGRRSAGGTCRLLRAADRWVAVNLARPDDAAAVDAIVAGDAGDDPWLALAASAAAATAEEFVARVRLLGVPAATLVSPGPAASPPLGGDGGADGIGRPGCLAHRLWQPLGPRRLEGLRVLDLSSMWAGPLAARILADAGAEVTKVESTTRPDGARSEPGFYRLLHPEGQPELRLDLAAGAGRDALRALAEEADVVIEASRPRALEQLGAGPLDVTPRAGRVWVSISGHGRDAPGRDWVAFGDDAAVAGGLVAREEADRPVFCGDAIADPVTGLTAAAAALEALARGGGVLLDVSMAASCRALVDPGTATEPSGRAERGPAGGWELPIDGERVPVLDPVPAHRAV